MKKKVAAAVIAVIILAVVFKLLGDSDKVNIPEAVTKVQSAISGQSSGTPSAAVTDEDDNSAGSPFKYYYSKLSAAEKQAYDNVLAKVYSFPQYVRGQELR